MKKIRGITTIEKYNQEERRNTLEHMKRMVIWLLRKNEFQNLDNLKINDQSEKITRGY